MYYRRVRAGQGGNPAKGERTERGGKEAGGDRRGTTTKKREGRGTHCKRSPCLEGESNLKRRRRGKEKLKGSLETQEEKGRAGVATVRYKGPQRSSRIMKNSKSEQG